MEVESDLPFDFPILYLIQEHLTAPLIDSVMVFISAIGEGGIVWIVSALIMLFFKRTRKCGLLVLISMLICFITGELVIKNIVCRIRPCYVDTAMELLVSRPDSYSFPSGHTASSFTAASVMFYFFRKLGVFALLFAALMAFSRMYLFVHFPTDILGGILLGIMGATLVVFVYKKCFENRADRLNHN